MIVDMIDDRDAFRACRKWVYLGLGAAVLAVVTVQPAHAQNIIGVNTTDTTAAPASLAEQPRGSADGDLANARGNEAMAGEVGVRRTRTQMSGIRPTSRISTRISNRVQNRIRNRIDRFYDPRANATSPFETAEEQAERNGLTGNR